MSTTSGECHLKPRVDEQFLLQTGEVFQRAHVVLVVESTSLLKVYSL